MEFSSAGKSANKEDWNRFLMTTKVSEGRMSNADVFLNGTKRVFKTIVSLFLKAGQHVLGVVNHFKSCFYFLKFLNYFFKLDES